VIETLIRILRRVLPRAFDERFGSEMTETARALDAERPRRPLRIVRAAGDAITTAAMLHFELRREARRHTHRRTGSFLDAFTRDFRYAVRGLRRNPGFALFVCTALSLGIGANVTMLGIGSRLILAGPAQVLDADRLVQIQVRVVGPAGRITHNASFGHVTYDLLSRRARSFGALGTYTVNDGFLGRGEGARPVRLGYASASLFPLLGVRPSMGRFFTPAEDGVIGAEPVVVISHGAWRDWLGAPADAIGRPVVLDDQVFSVIGVAPPGFTGPQFGRVDAWVPMNLLSPRVTRDFRTAWTAQWLQIVGRLAPGITAENASEEATAIFRDGYDGPRALPDDLRVEAVGLRAVDLDLDRTQIGVLLWLTGVAVVVLLVACANVANLLLARGLRRARELAVRAALGASRTRLVRLLLFETTLLAAGGGTVGLLIAGLAGAFVRATLFASVDWSYAPPGWTTAWLTCALVVLAALATGLVPAVRVSREALGGRMKTDLTSTGERRSRLRTGLTVVQAALSVLLLVLAGLFGRSWWNLYHLDLGIDSRNVYVFELDWPPLSTVPEGPSREAERTRRASFFLDEAASVRTMTIVEEASAAVGMPFGYRFGLPIQVPGVEELPRLGDAFPSVSAVGPHYFRTTGTAILRGRPFDERDGAGTEPVAIVSSTMAETIWPGLNALGQCIVIGAAPSPCARVVGIAEDTHRSRLRETPGMHYYIPAGQERGFGGSVLLVRLAPTAAESTSVIIRRLIADDPRISRVTVESVQDRIDPQVQPWQQATGIFLISGLLALLVAGIGIYSVVSYVVTDRQREFGVRLALGARPGNIIRLVLRGHLNVAAIGVCLGVGIAAAIGGWLEPVLFETSPRDPTLYAGIGFLLLLVATLAALVPALRARTLNPVDVLRSD